MIITMSDVRAANMCSRGARAFLTPHGYDWSTFLREGVPEAFLLETQDAMALKVVEVARGRR